MKKNSIFLYFLTLFLFITSFSVSGETLSGYEKSLELSKLLEKNNVKSTAQTVIYSEDNNYPFNLIVSFNSNNTRNFSKLVLAFKTEEILENKQILINTLNSLKELSCNYKTELLFTSGDSDRSLNPAIKSGTEAYIESLTEKEDINIICINLGRNDNSIITGGNTMVSPRKLVKTAALSLNHEKMIFHLNGGIINAIYKLNLMENDYRVAQYLGENIPCTGINFSSSESDESIANVISKLPENFEPVSFKNWDRHSNNLLIGTKLLQTSERFTVIMFLICSFSGLAILFELSFLYKRSKLDISKDVLRLWYIIPVSVLITAGFFVLGQKFTALISAVIKMDPLSLICVKSLFGFAGVTIVFMISLRLQGILVENAYSYLLTLSALLNILIFSTAEISLFFLFFIEYLIIYISRLLKSTGALVTIFFTMLIPFIPYIYEIVQFSNPNSIKDFINAPITLNLLLSFAFVPFEIVWLRIITRLNSMWKKANPEQKKFMTQNAVFLGIAILITILLLFVTTRFIPEQYKNSNLQEKFTPIRQSFEDIIAVDVKDNTYFGETSRSVNVKLSRKTEMCLVTVKGANSIPVLYSDFEYITDTKNLSQTFISSLNPPEEFTIRYIASTSDYSTILVKAWTLDEKNQDKNALILFEAEYPVSPVEEAANES